MLRSSVRPTILLLLAVMLLAPCGLGSPVPEETDETKPEDTSIWTHLLQSSGGTGTNTLGIGVGSAVVDFLWSTGRYMKNATAMAKASNLEKKRARIRRQRAEAAQREKEAWLRASKEERRRKYIEREEEYRKNQVKLYNQYMIQKQQMEVLQRHQEEPWARYDAWLERPDVQELLTPEAIEELTNKESHLAQIMPILVLAHPTEEEVRQSQILKTLSMMSSLSTPSSSHATPMMTVPGSISSSLTPSANTSSRLNMSSLMNGTFDKPPPLMGSHSSNATSTLLPSSDRT
ncbi:MAG: hypothetical protein DHS80DRAFT_23529 [Piptocephalis tieghemiana]|nr:MAG: hypothetical protein DHS80DRAFT_23529 [Piptocephalis tieghemiana]